MNHTLLNSMKIKLYGVCYLSSLNPYCTMRLQNSSSGYQVPDGYTLKIKYFFANMNRRRNPSVWPLLRVLMDGSLGYGDNDVGFGSATKPTGAKFIGSFSNEWLPVGSLGQYAEALIDFEVPARKYPFSCKTNSRDNLECAFIMGGDLI